MVACEDCDLPGVAAVHLATRRSAYAGLLPERVLERMTASALHHWWERRLRLAPRPHVMLIGIRDPRRRRVVGFVHAGPGEDAETGELYAIHVHPTMQGHGYGQRLLNAAMRELACMGYQRAQLWVLQGNEPAQGFYRRHGWNLVDGARRNDEIEGAVVAEVAYVRGLPSLTQHVRA